MFTIEEIRDIIIKRGAKIGLERTSDRYPMFTKEGRVFGDGHSVYVTETEYHYVITERGNENEHYKGEHIDDILYPIFDNITFWLAAEYEVKHRKKGEDSRKQMWKKQLKLLKSIDKRYAKIREEQIDEILKKHPYR